MKNNQMMAILVGALLLSTLASAGIVYEWDSLFRRDRVLQGQYQKMQEASALMQRLFVDTAEYAKSTGNKELEALLNTPYGAKNHNVIQAKPQK